MWQKLVHRTNVRTLKNVQRMHVNVKGYICTKQIVSIYVCVLYCSGQLVVEQKVSAWWAVWADFGIHREKQQRQGHFPSRGSEMCECVRENACGSFYILFVKVHSIQSQIIVLLTIMPLYHLSNSLGGCQLKWAQWCIVLWLVVPCAGINLLSAPCTQQCLKVTFGLDLEPKLMF